MLIYRLILSARDKAYKTGRRKSQKASVPTICVGNITVGGTGKTPHTELILRTLGATSDIAVLSRGYKRKSKGYREVSVDGSARIFGDEPLQIKKNFPSVRVAVDKDRVEGCANLSSVGAKVIVLDDAFQYRKLKADLNIVLVDHSRPVSTDHLLPFGRLRDLPRRIFDADMVVVTKCPYLYPQDKTDYVLKLGFLSFDPATMKAVAPSGRIITLLFSQLAYSEPLPVFEDTDSRYTYSHEVVLFSGIANDRPLVRYLSGEHHVFESIRFADHHAFRRPDVRKIAAAARRCPVAGIATTQKDAQRVLDCGLFPPELRKKMYCVPVEAVFLTEEEGAEFAAVLKAAACRD